MAELIDREALLDGLEELFKRRELNATYTGNRGCAVTWNDAINAIKDAPTAQPTLELDEWCDDCKEYDKEWHCCPRWNRVIRQTLEEVEPQRLTGRWVPEFNGRFTGGAYWFSCSRCKRIVPDVRNGGWNYCPECGADMREGEE